MINYVDFLKIAEKLTKGSTVDSQLKAVLVKGGIAYATDRHLMFTLKGLNAEAESEVVEFKGFSGSKYPETVERILTQYLDKIHQEFEIEGSLDNVQVRVLRDMARTFKDDYFKIWTGKDGVFMGFDEEGKSLAYRISSLPGKNEEVYFSGNYLATAFDALLKTKGPIKIAFTGTLSPVIFTRGDLLALLMPIRRF